MDAAADFKHSFLKTAGARQIALSTVSLGQVVHRDKGSGMLLAQDAAAYFKHSFIKTAGHAVNTAF